MRTHAIHKQRPLMRMIQEQDKPKSIAETKQQQFEKLLTAQRERFAQQEAEKLRFKDKVKEYIVQGYPRTIALSFAKHGIH